MGSDSVSMPRYSAIEHDLRRIIADKEIGDLLPSEAALCIQYSVSRMTIRNAMRGLVEDGLVNRIPGKGTFVAPASANNEERANRKAAAGTARIIDASSRVLDILAEEGEASLSVIVQRTGEPRTLLRGLLGSLEAWESVEQPAPGLYRLGLRHLKLFAALKSRLTVREAALRTMEQLHQDTGETVNLLVRRELSAICIESLRGVRVRLMALDIGGRLPLHAGAAPRALLAFQDRSFWDHYFKTAELRPLTGTTPVTRDEIIPLLEATRRSRVSLSDNDVTPGIATIGAPIFDDQGAVCAAVSLGGIRETIIGGERRASNVLLVKNASAVISRALGYRDRGAY